MDNKTICTYIQSTNDINGYYCDITEHFFAQKAFQKYDYDNSIKILAQIKDELINIQKKLNAVEVLTLDEDAKKVFSVLIPYQVLLLQRISDFNEFLLLLKQKSEAEGKYYSYFTYKSHIKRYNQLEKIASQNGTVLQGIVVPFMRQWR